MAKKLRIVPLDRDEVVDYMDECICERLHKEAAEARAKSNLKEADYLFALMRVRHWHRRGHPITRAGGPKW